MRDVEHGNPTREFSLHLTLLSSDIIKSSAREASKISISCDISEVPKVNCTIIFSRQNQDLGPIGSIEFSKNRPVASAFVNLSEESFDELSGPEHFSLNQADHLLKFDYLFAQHDQLFDVFD